ncbi:DUF1918 domain-containing protein [Nannocystis pusilla]|uniref:DUF1918 domain-containing protein n=1 Tax=Nannocystis pusilla TaxID=889268 RepID=UPI003DA684EC
MERLLVNFSNRCRRSCNFLSPWVAVELKWRRIGRPVRGWPRLTGPVSQRKNARKEFTMRAHVGDSIRITVLRDPPLIGEIVEILGPDGAPPYRVKFPNGHELVMNPSPDTIIEHRQPR